jgi:small-conductance mechanosensitive channel
MLEKFFENVISPAYYIPLAIGLGTFTGLWIVKNVVIKRLKRISSHTQMYLDDIVLAILEETKNFFILTVSLYLGFQAFYLDKVYGKWVDKVFVVLVALQGIIWAKQAVNSWVAITIKRKNDDPSVKTSLGFLGLILKFLLIAGVLLFALNNLGVNVSTFITGLGVGGVAIALATQNILSDLFSSLSIVMDKPFIVGDFITIGEWMGTIEHVGLKTTRLRSLGGEQIIMSNTDLLASKIRNYKRMQERRVVFQLGVTYQTKREDLKRAPGIVEEIIKRLEGTRFDRAHFVRYGASSLDIEIVYWVLSPDYLVYADLHQKVLFEIHEAFETNNLDFAYPTQTLFIEKVNQSPA